MGALCPAAEVFDWRRFPTARAFMGFTGLTYSENSTGLTERRGAITRAGNSHIRGQLGEAAWSYQHRPGLGPTQNRLSKRFAALAARKNVKSVVATAAARELAGFLWAQMTATA
jgi:transposase